MDKFEAMNAVQLSEMVRKAEEQKRKEEEEKRKKEEFEKQMLELTKQIRDNTSSLSEIVTLLRQSNLNQEEIRFVMDNIADLIRAKDRKEAESIFRRALAKINDASRSVESIGNLNKAFMFVYSTVVPLLDKIPK